MENSKDTVIVTGLGRDTTREDFINHFKRVGNILKSNIATGPREGIVTYADAETAEMAVEELNGGKLNGNKIKVEKADESYRDYFDEVQNEEHTERDEINTAWSIWSERTGSNCGGGGKGGKGGVGGPGMPSGHAGEDGEPGPGGKGGAGGRPAINNSLRKRPYNEGMDYDVNERNSWFGGGKGGKGGKGGPGMPSGHDGEDGEPGPFGKGGAGGRPAVSVPINIFQHSVPWYTRWFGIGGSNKNNENRWNGGARGNIGRGEWYGHDGQDGEDGLNGRPGAGGRPAN